MDGCAYGDRLTDLRAQWPSHPAHAAAAELLRGSLALRNMMPLGQPRHPWHETERRVSGRPFLPLPRRVA